MNKIFRNRWTIAVVAMIAAISAQAQALSPIVLSTGGQYYTSTGNSLSVTIGEMTMVETFTASSSILTQGFQQPLDFHVGVRDISEIDWNVTAYPNPTKDYVSVIGTGAGSAEIALSLYDAAGRRVADYGVMSRDGSSVLDMRSLASGVYILHMYAQSVSRNIRLIRD